MQDLMGHMIQDLYSAETQALDAMTELAERATSDELRQAFHVHLRETEQQVQRLEQIAMQMEIEPEGETCLAMQGLIDETEELLSQLDDNQLADAAIIGAAQKMEHYEIASYGTARTLAQQAGLEDIANLLQLTLKEEKATNEKLTYLATNQANPKAAQA